MKELERRLKEKEAEILKLHQQISSQESSLAQGGINLPEKTVLLSGLTKPTTATITGPDTLQKRS